jgi:NADH-quinone oxidoreductase subunit L
MLSNVWILPALMVAAFVIILFFGKRLPQGGWWVGQAAITACLALSVVAGAQWQQREKVPVSELHSAEGRSAEGGHSAEKGAEGHSTEDGAADSEDGAHSPEGASADSVVIAEGEGEALASVAGGPGAAVVTAEEGKETKLRPPVRREWTWFEDGNVTIKVGTHADGFAIAMLFVVSFISFCVHLFSREYLRHDSRFVHYFASLALFTGAMLWMVQSSTTLGLLFGWELMGLCSFLLIGHWWEDGNNTNAALKAFFTTRTGDVGLLIGIIILFFAAGQSFDIATINALALDGSMSHLVLLVAACCLFMGVIGKSAQFPLHTWLPDAMAGPTPASSLIHAATMVVAGVYLVGRLYGVFFEGFSIAAGGMNLGSWIGSITLVMAALLAFVQTDIKKVLAYSTVSQLGYMVMGLAVGAWAAAIFHLFTHAFFKALLFQAAGSISHSGSHHSFEMDRMGGLRKYMPWTFATFTVGYLALIGIPPFSGFWSKDEILNHAAKNDFTLAFIAGSLGAFLTACYMTRVMIKTFFGENRLHLAHDDHGAHSTHDAHAAHDTPDAHDAHAAHDAHGHGDGHDEGPHESNWWILGALVALAVPSALVGFLQWPGWFKLPKYVFEYYIEDLVFEETVLANKMLHPFATGVAIPSIALAVAGVIASWTYYYVFKGDLGLVRRYSPFRVAHKVLKNKYYLDHLWTGVIIGFVKKPLAQAAYWFNQKGIDGAVNGIGTGAVTTARFVYRFIDQRGVDGAVNGAGQLASGVGGALRRLQTGRVQNYAAVFVAAAALIGFAIAVFAV